MLTASWWRRRRFACAGLALYSFLAIAVMAPLASRELPLTPAQDLGNHVSGIIEASRALGEGQFPIRVAPDQNDSTRYPIFQFYGNLPYTLGGAVHLVTRADPYSIWKAEVIAFLVLGGFFVYRTARFLTRQPLPALAAGAVFITAPYVLTDIHGRYAFPEIVSFMLLPLVFYCSLRSWIAPRLGPILASGASWSALILSHNVTFLYAGIFLGLFYLSWLGPGRKQLVRILRVGAGFALGLILTAWSIVPQTLLVPEFCFGLHADVFKGGWLTPLGVLLAPSLSLPVHLPTIYIGEPGHFGLQVGWPILAAVGLALWQRRDPWTRLNGRAALLIRFIGLLVLALMMTWMPVNYWRILPPMLDYVQFSYRFLMFVVLWGALVSAYALALGFGGKMRPIHLAAVVIGLGWSAAPYMSPHKADPSVSVAQELAHPEMGRGGAGATYALAGEKLAATSLLHPEMNWVSLQTGGKLDNMEFHRYGRIHAAFPAPQNGDQIFLQGTVNTGAPELLHLNIFVNETLIATHHLPEGPFQLLTPLPLTASHERAVVTIQGDPILTPPPPPHTTPFRKESYTLTELCLRSGNPSPTSLRLLPAETIRAQMRFGHPTRVRLSIPEPTLVQLPVVYYPHVLRLDVDGRSVPVQNLGRYVALELPPGEHVLSVRFVGTPWATAVSAAAWSSIAISVVAMVARKRWGRRRSQKPRRLFAALRLLPRALRKAHVATDFPSCENAPS